MPSTKFAFSNGVDVGRLGNGSGHGSMRTFYGTSGKVFVLSRVPWQKSRVFFRFSAAPSLISQGLYPYGVREIFMRYARTRYHLSKTLVLRKNNG
jgi:hypothetical protein